MKKLIFTLIFCLVASFALAQNATNDNSSSTSDAYKIELGDGQGSLIITGDNNTIYLPPETEECEQVPNEMRMSTGNLILRDTNVIGLNGTITSFSKVVLQFQPDGRIKVLWAEQEQ